METYYDEKKIEKKREIGRENWMKIYYNGKIKKKIKYVKEIEERRENKRENWMKIYYEGKMKKERKKNVKKLFIKREWHWNN